jgi:hypothetical protein
MLIQRQFSADVKVSNEEFSGLKILVLSSNHSCSLLAANSESESKPSRSNDKSERCIVREHLWDMVGELSIYSVSNDFVLDWA